MKRKIIIPLILVALLLGSCNDFLDVKPIGRVIPEKVADLDKLLNNSNTVTFTFMDNNRGCFYSLLGDNVYISENQANYFYSTSGSNLDRYAAFTFYKPYTDPQMTHYFWNWNIYRAVKYFNNVIDGIADLGEPESSSAYALSVIAQAKAARAWIYLMGGLVYGPMYDPSGANDTRVIPYRTAGEPLVPNPDLATTQEIFDLAWQDLEDALHAPEGVPNPSRASLTAVHAIRAQYYMFKRDWPNMLTEANTAWDMAIRMNGRVSNLLYDFNNFSYIYVGDPPTDGTDHEVGLSLTGNDTKFNATDSRENILYRQAPTGTAHYPTQEWLDLFADYEDIDMRYKLFVLTGNGYSNGAAGVSDGLQKYNYRGDKMNISGGITYPELLLMRAEAYARTGALDQARDDVYLLRSYRYAGNSQGPDLSSLSQDELIHEILNERRKEQPIDSYKRTLDIKRYFFDTGKPWSKTSITHTLGSQTYTQPVNSEYFTLEIDNAIIEFNPHWGLTPDDRPWLPKG